MLYAATDVLAMFVVGKRACTFADGMEVECLIVAAGQITFQLVEVVLFAVGKQLDKRELVAEVIEYDYIFI